VRKEKAHYGPLVPLDTTPPNDDYDQHDGRQGAELGSYSSTDLEQVTVDDLLERLPEHQRKAFILKYRMGFEAESVDKRKTTVATLCGVSGRTVRDWLKEAKQTLKRVAQEEV
jgi:DNA-directed RNA polymerase specialized sigma24 family protein